MERFYIFLFSLLPMTSWLSFGSIILTQIDTANTIQCFCTAKDCKGPLCEGSWCLVGFKSDVELVQRCATDSSKALIQCARKLNEWEEVCSCKTDYCNTFTYMRETLKKYDEFRIAHPNVPNDLDGFDTSEIEDKEAKKGDEHKISPNKHLILILVVVPLGIGAVTVCLVFLNYHCKMC